MSEKKNTILLAGLGLTALSALGYLVVVRSKSSTNKITNSSKPEIDAPSKKERPIITPTLFGIIRPDDFHGSGQFGASRGHRTHKGVDYSVDEKDPILAPIYGRISRYPYPYAGDIHYKGIEIIGLEEHSAYKVKLFYVNPSIAIGTIVEPGTIIGYAQNISARYGPALSMNNHVHMEIYKNGKIIDPNTVTTV